MISTDVIIVIPMKPLAVAKSRLCGILRPHERMALARNLLERVLAVVQDVDVSDIWVVGGDAVVQQRATVAGASWLPEERAGLNETVGWAFWKAQDMGKAPLYIPADLPFLQPADLQGLIRTSGNLNQVTLAPARLGLGTNGILLAERADFRPALGPGSFQRHLCQIASQGVRAAIYDSTGLAWDLDTAEDLALYESVMPGLIAELIAGGPEL